jgi:hypothetical protein
MPLTATGRARGHDFHNQRKSLDALGRKQSLELPEWTASDHCTYGPISRELIGSYLFYRIENEVEAVTERLAFAGLGDGYLAPGTDWVARSFWRGAERFQNIAYGVRKAEPSLISVGATLSSANRRLGQTIQSPLAAVIVQMPARFSATPVGKGTLTVTFLFPAVHSRPEKGHL